MNNQLVPLERLKGDHITFDIILHIRDPKLFWVHETPIRGAKSALPANRHLTRLPNNWPNGLRSLHVKDCTTVANIKLFHIVLGFDMLA